MVKFISIKIKTFSKLGFTKNIGYGSDITIRELAEKIADAAGFTGKIVWDASKPDGMYRKLMDSSRAHSLGWSPKISLEEGIARTVKEFSESHDFRGQ